MSAQTKATHTPGPWSRSHGWARAANDIVSVENIYGPPPIGVVAKVVRAAQDAQITDERDANARLIAAAPELLEALKKCDDAFVSWQVGQMPGRPEDILALIEEVRAAIRSATGGDA